MEVQNTRKHNTEKIFLELEFKGFGFMCQGGPTGRISKTQALLATNKVSIPMRPKWVSDYPPPAQHGLACLQMLIKANDRRPRKNLNQRLISDGLASASHILHLYCTRLYTVFFTSGSTKYVFIYIVHYSLYIVHRPRQAMFYPVNSFLTADPLNFSRADKCLSLFSKFYKSPLFRIYQWLDESM